MMKLVVFLTLLGMVACETGDTHTVGKNVFDLQQAPLNAAQVSALGTSKAAAYPTYRADAPPKTAFSCASKKQPGFYADLETQCQVYHRCDPAGIQTDYICVNSTVYNQITLVCESFYNVNCAKNVEYENFANARLYTNLPLFDNAPADYLAPSQLVLLQNQAVSQQAAKN
ncbi:hypothetical protein BV898_06541 [Hypsibius exemplaris]|uniref:Chitin-binding type-2 domain-containing protein n=1 Tax=Hypsibius exemplaris TaxID=2072580 RepID=A0A1W0WW84_HYPEX|nr:hypothetical protein BV898_06541 [Hypsibius exemplaris]